MAETASHEHIGEEVAVDVSGADGCGNETIDVGGGSIRDRGVLEGGPGDDVRDDRKEEGHCRRCGGGGGQ